MADPPECLVPPATALNGDEPRPPSKTISIEGNTFFVVRATAESLVLLGDYFKIVVNLELVVTDVMSRIIEFLKVGRRPAPAPTHARLNFLYYNL